jgi:hypothetical protein
MSDFLLDGGVNVKLPQMSGDDDSSTTIFVVRNLCTVCDSSGPIIYIISEECELMLCLFKCDMCSKGTTFGQDFFF